MLIGMLWFDNNPEKTITEKVRGAIVFFQNKFEYPILEIHARYPGIPEDCEVDGFPVYYREKLQNNHIWVIYDKTTPINNNLLEK